MNIIYNILIAALGSYVVYLLQGFVPFQIYAQAPWPAQLLIALVFTFAFFVFILWLKKRALANKEKWPILAKIIFYPFGTAFLFCDVQFNVCFASWLFLQSANHHGEGWTLTSRLKYLIDVGEFEIGENIKPDWRYYVAVRLGQLVDSADPGHTGRTL